MQDRRRLRGPHRRDLRDGPPGGRRRGLGRRRRAPGSCCLRIRGRRRARPEFQLPGGPEAASQLGRIPDVGRVGDERLGQALDVVAAHERAQRSLPAGRAERYLRRDPPRPNGALPRRPALPCGRRAAHDQHRESRRQGDDPADLRGQRDGALGPLRSGWQRRRGLERRGPRRVFTDLQGDHAAVPHVQPGRDPWVYSGPGRQPAWCRLRRCRRVAGRSRRSRASADSGDFGGRPCPRRGHGRGRDPPVRDRRPPRRRGILGPRSPLPPFPQRQASLRRG